LGVQDEAVVGPYREPAGTLPEPVREKRWLLILGFSVQLGCIWRNQGAEQLIGPRYRRTHMVMTTLLDEESRVR
jgi:hypothetical protein